MDRSSARVENPLLSTDRRHSRSRLACARKKLEEPEKLLPVPWLWRFYRGTRFSSTPRDRKRNGESPRCHRFVFPFYHARAKAEERRWNCSTVPRCDRSSSLLKCSGSSIGRTTMGHTVFSRRGIGLKHGGRRGYGVIETVL